MWFPIDVHPWLSHTHDWHFTTEVGIIAAIGLVSLAVAHLVRK